MSAWRLWLRRIGLHGLDRRLKRALGVRKSGMSHPPYPAKAEREIRRHIDRVRYATIALALNRIRTDRVNGALAELGVFKGEMSQFLAAVADGRILHLFDTFAGFPASDLEAGEHADPRFTDTSEAAVRRRIGDCSRVRFHVGAFPGTAARLANERFAFVMLDADKYKPTLAGLEFFYPRTTRGGYIFLHDYNNPESDFAVSRAVHDFLRDQPEQLVEIPDASGSVLLRKA